MFLNESISSFDEISVSKQNPARWDAAFFNVNVLSMGILFAYLPTINVLNKITNTNVPTVYVKVGCRGIYYTMW